MSGHYASYKINVKICPWVGRVNADTIIQCDLIRFLERNFIKRGEIPQLYVDLPRRIEIDGVREEVFEVIKQHEVFVVV